MATLGQSVDLHMSTMIDSVAFGKHGRRVDVSTEDVVRTAELLRGLA